MKYFLLRLLAFALLYVCAVNPLMNMCFDRIVMRDTLLRRTTREFDRADSLDVLILGDSHTMNSVDARLIPGAYNYSSNGESYLQTWYKLSWIIDRGEPVVQAVVLPLDLHSFSSFRTGRIEDPLYWQRYIDWIDLTQRLGLAQGLRFCVESFLFPWAGCMAPSDIEFDVLAGRRPVQDLSMGFRPVSDVRFSESVEEERAADARKRAVRHFEGSDPLDGRLLHCFSDILDLCSDSGVTVIVVSYPVTEEYEVAAAGYVTRNELMAEFRKAAGDYTDVHYLDYSMIFGDEDENFRNSDHLNAQGAEIFTRRLAADLEPLTSSGRQIRTGSR
jgi:hypothetical protein